MALHPSSVLFLLATLLVLTTCSDAFEAPNVTLPYISLSGSYSPTYNITYYRRIPYGASTAGGNRFRAPQPPPNISGVYDTDRPFPSCPLQDGTGSEDCLYLGLYSRPWTPGRPLRPVTVVFHGGAYVAGTASFDVPPYGYPTLNVSHSWSPAPDDDNDDDDDDDGFVLVYPNYRLGALGFLPGRALIASPGNGTGDSGTPGTAALNVGLRDQRAALRWVRDHIARFGGDPADVSVFGQSAGGGSVVAQTIAARDPDAGSLFRRALASSPFWLKTYRYDDPEAEALYEGFVGLTGCPLDGGGSGSGGGSNTLECLRGLDLGTIMNASAAVAARYVAPHFVWAPVIDGSLLRETLTEAVAGGRPLNAELVWGMFNSDEGASFVDGSLDDDAGTGTGPYNATEAGFRGWLADFFPRFSSEQLRAVESVYPAAGRTDSSSWTWNTTFGRASYIYRDTVLACPAYWLASAAPKTGWLGEYTVPPARHGSDEPYICLEPGYNSSCTWNTVPTSDPTQLLRYHGYAGAIASFLETGDPNAHKITNESTPGVPELRTNMEFSTDADGFHNLRIPILEERCAFWFKEAKSLPI